jgi:DNA-binding CsgD family transcriptional regulator/thioredoxin-like negative regulator of GroEL
VEQTLDVLAGQRRSVAITGVAGSGISRFLSEIHQQLHRRGVPVRLVSGRSALSGRTDFPTMTLPRAETVIIDDAQSLDDRVAAEVMKMVTGRQVTVVLGVVEGRSLPAPLLAILTHASCTKIRLDPLSRQDSEELLGRLLDGHVDPSTTQRLWTLTTGRPRHLIALARELIDTHGLVLDVGTGEEIWRWPEPQLLPPVFRSALLGEHLTGLPPDERDVVDMVSISGPVSPRVLISAGATEQVLERLECAQVLRVRNSGRRLLITMSDRLLALAVFQRLGQLRRRRLGRQLTRSWQEQGLRRRDDHLRIAKLMIGVGEPPPADIAESGAQQAIMWGNYVIGEVLARSALDNGGGLSAQISLAQALSYTGKAQEAETMLRAAEDIWGDDPLVALTRAMNLRWGLSDRKTAQMIVEKVLRRDRSERFHDSARLALAEFRIHDGHFGEALDLSDSVLSEESPSTRTRYRAWTISISALSSLGRDTDATDLAQRTSRAFGSDPTRRHSEIPEAVWYYFFGAVARAHLLHGNLDEAEDLAHRFQDSASGHQPKRLATCGAILGEVALRRGQFGLARRTLEESFRAVRGIGDHDLPGRTVRVLVTKALARTYLESGNPEGALSVLAQLSSRDLQDLSAVDLWTGDLEVLGHVASHRLPQGVDRALATARRFRDIHAWGAYLVSLHQVVQLGGADQIPVGALDGVRVQGPLLEAQLMQVRAAIRQDPQELEIAASRFHDLHFFPLAVEASTAAAHLHERARRHEDSRRSIVRARSNIERCDSPPRMMAARLYEPAVLTPRQREIARLAASGMSSRQIANHLVLSVRTVDNYLGQIYRRLDISGRLQLTAMMRPVPENL